MAELYMTIDEIVRSYQRADDPVEQVKILAQLNACTKNDIIDVLMDAKVYQGSVPVSRSQHRAGTEYSSKTGLEKKAKVKHRRRSAEEQDWEYGPLYKQGLNDTQMAAKAGVSVSAITGWRRRRGLAPNRLPGWNGQHRQGKEGEDGVRGTETDGGAEGGGVLTA